MLRPLIAGVLLLSWGGPLAAQDNLQECTRPDSVAVRGNVRATASTIRSDAGITPGMIVDRSVRQRAIRGLLESSSFDDVRLFCEIDDGTRRSTLILEVKERPLLGSLRVSGTDAVSERAVRERIDVLPGRPLDPAQVVRAKVRIDSLYESRGYYLAEVVPETTVVNNATVLTFRIDEGRRLAVAGINVVGNAHVSAEDIVAAMVTHPEGFWWWERGAFDDDLYARDLSDSIPALYHSRGFIDMQVLRDTLIVDREAGKAILEITVSEGPQYHVGKFEIVNNRHFSTDELMTYYPFTPSNPTLGERLAGIIKRDALPEGVFDERQWEESVRNAQTAYANEGYIQADVAPVVDRALSPDSTHIVNLRWDVTEGPLAIVRSVVIRGNTYTSETCIRQQIVVLPGSVYSQERVIRSMGGIGNLNFFELPIEPPDVQFSGDQGDVSIAFNVKEKKSGNISFGASVGQGAGIGGFLGADQPNLFGRCKRGSLQWQYGQLVNDFNMSYSDPSIKGTTLSGSVSAYHTRSRYVVRDFGQQIRSGGSIRVGFPLFGSSFSKVFVSYGGEKIKYGNDPNSLLGQLATECDNCFRSNVGVTVTRDTRIGLPFAYSGLQQTFDVEFNGGPLGGTAKFQRFTLEQRFYTSLGTIGGAARAEPMVIVLGLNARSGMVSGNTGPFFPFQEFSLGGTQQGEQLRGYDEFSITPAGYVAGEGSIQATRSSFGRAFFTTTAELGLRVNGQLYLDAFFDAGNVWNHPREFSPTRLFRGVGIGASLVTPLGPLGLDWAYGIDRLDAAGNPAPKWKLHFKFGQLF